MLESAAQTYSRPEIEFTFREWKIDGKSVLEVDIPKGENKPCYAPDTDGNWKVYIT